MEENLAKSDKIWIKYMKYGKSLGCHQRYDRSFVVNNYQFPVCSRCTGVILGYLFSPILLLINNNREHIALVMCLVMFLDWYIQYLKIKESNNIRRLITGIAGGIGIVNVFIYAIHMIINIISKVI